VSSTTEARVGVLALPRPNDREVLLAFVVALVVAVFSPSSIQRSYSNFWEVLLKERTGAVEFLAIAVMALLVFRFRREDLLSRSDLITVAAVSLAFVLPFRFAVSLPLTVAGMKLAFHRDPRVYSVGQILLGLAFYEWLGPTLFHILAPLTLKFETLAVQGMLAPFGGFTRNGLTIVGSSHHHITIDAGCSAFHNLSVSTLIWIALLKLDTLTIKSAHYWIAAAMAGATVALNTGRIALMAQSPEMFKYWHDGAGVPIVQITMFAVILVICLGGLSLVESRRWADPI
jgi:exosortase/archaeosortase family protein